MVGRELVGQLLPARGRSAPPAETRARGARTCSCRARPRRCRFSASRGEILGFAGLVGLRADRADADHLRRDARRSGGSMRLEGRAFLPRRTSDAIRRGVYLAPEDRKRHGLVLPMTVAENTSLPGGPHATPASASSTGPASAASPRPRWRASASRRPRSSTAVVNLSGGNQQKVVLGKWLAMEPRVLILDEPTRGIDVGAKAEIYRHMAALADAGPHHPDGQLRDGGGAGHERPRGGHARAAHRGRAPAGRPDRRAHRAADDRRLRRRGRPHEARARACSSPWCSCAWACGRRTTTSSAPRT